MAARTKSSNTSSTGKKEVPLGLQIVSALFNNKNFINSLTKSAISSNSFIVNRRLAIKYPLQAQVFNNSDVNPVDVLYFWRDYLYNGVSAPGWTFTPGQIKSSAGTSKNDFTKAEIKMFCEHFDIDRKDLNAAFKFFPKEIKKEITNYLKFLNDAKSNI